MDIKKYIETRHQFPKTFTIEQMEEFIEQSEDLDMPEPRVNAALKKSPIKKGMMDGEKFDSQWEAAVWIYYKKIKCVPCERNRIEVLVYFDINGKKRKFIPDFKISGRFVEVKGQYRDSDLAKMEQHPEVEFIDSTNIGPLLTEVNKLFPNWKNDYLIMN